MNELNHLTLLNNFILAEAITEENCMFDNTRVVISSQPRNGLSRGKVVATCNAVPVDSVIFYDPRNSQEIKLDEKEYVLVHTNSIYCFTYKTEEKEEN